MIQRLRSDRGAINLVAISFYMALAVAGYFAWIYIPVLMNYYAVRQAVQVSCNVAYRSRDEGAVKDAFMKSWKGLNIEDETVEDGQVSKSATPLDRDNDLEVTLVKEPPQVTMTIHYTEKIVYPLLKKEKEVSWTYTHTEDLKNITY